jgi:tetratricopeptide (TPR) repeat protein
VKNMFFDILNAKVDFFKKVDLLLKLIYLYYQLIYGIIILIPLAYLAYILYSVPNSTVFIKYYVNNIYSLSFILFVFLLISISVIKYIGNPKREMFYEGLGDIYFYIDNKNYAANAYKKSLEFNANRAYAWLRLGDLHVSLSDYDQAIIDYNNSININKKIFLSWKRLGDVYFCQSKTEMAIDAYVNALAIKSMPEIKIKLGLLYQTDGESNICKKLYEMAIKSLDLSVKNDPLRERSWELLGDTYVLLENHELAINAYEQAIKLNASATLKYKIFPSLMIVGRQYFKEGDLERSKGAFERATEVDPQSATGWTYFGEVSSRQGNFLDAENAYRNALSIDPKLASSWIGLGNVLAQQNNFKEAEEAYRNALSIDPKLASSWIGLGNVLAQQNNFKEAGEAYRNALSIDPKLASSWIGLGNVLAQQNNFEEAEEAYRNALSIDPKLASSWIGLGNVLAQQGKYHDSMGAYNKAVECDVSNESELNLRDIKDSLKLRITLDDLVSSILKIENSNVALLLDTSSSMEGQKIVDAKEVIIKSLNLIPAGNISIDLIFFGGIIDIYKIDSTNYQRCHEYIVKKIRFKEANGNTPLMGALKRANKLLDNKGNRIIIIVTDGMPNDELPGIILEYAKAIKNAGCRMISVGIGKGVGIDETFLKKIVSNEADFYLADVYLDSKVVPYEYKYRFKYELLN